MLSILVLKPLSFERDLSLFAILSLLSAACTVLAVLASRFRQSLATSKGTSTEAPSVPINYISYIKRNILRTGEKKKKKLGQLDALTAMMDRSGWDTFQWRFLGKRALATRDPRNIQAMLATQFKDFDMGARKDNFRVALGRGIFASDGKEWEHSRAMIRPYFLKDNIKHANIEPHIQNLMVCLPTADDGWTETVDIQTHFFRLALDLSGDVFFGLDLRSQRTAQEKTKSDREEDEFSRFATSFDFVQDYLGVRLKLSWAYFLYDGIKFRRAISQINAFADKITRDALQVRCSAAAAAAATTSASSKKEDHDTETRPQRSTFLDQLLSAVPDNPSLVHSQLLHTLVAARDTIAVTMSWAFFELARHPDEYASLRASILESFGAYGQFTPDDGLPTRLKECQPLRSVVLETLRLHPPIPINARTATRDTTLPRGGGPTGADPVPVRKGEEVLYSVYALHRDPRLWGDDAAAFRPARWAGRRLGWDFLPFNGGPRICVGQQLALHEMSYVLVRLVQRFAEVRCADPVEGARVKLTLTNSSARGVVVRLREDEDLGAAAN